jgi:hypothetical protein
MIFYRQQVTLLVVPTVVPIDNGPSSFPDSRDRHDAVWGRQIWMGIHDYRELFPSGRVVKWSNYTSGDDVL